MSALGTEGMGFALNLGGVSTQAVCLHFYCISFGIFSFWRGILKSAYNVLFSTSTRSVLKTWTFLKLFELSVFVRVS